ncbi:MAG: hypothetical protein VZR00_02090 [Lachnospiraceae bacterium]|jgi:hypothetical protein|nr:hypothetical protein [Lachnospiraceae bacterium]MEE3460665.1 hypothetical protein [Lachnospiraceae bacterium]
MTDDILKGADLEGLEELMGGGDTKKSKKKAASVPVNVDEEEISLDGLDIEDDEEDTGSIVPDDIKSIKLLALIFDKKVVGYRFKTDKGYFDVTVEKAAEYGMNSHKVRTGLQVEKHNGIMISKTEIKENKLVPNVTDSQEDCDKLFNLLYTL